MDVLKCHVTGKIIHYTKSKAEKALQDFKTRVEYDGRVYYCEHCSGWHYGRPRPDGFFSVEMLTSDFYKDA